MEAAWERYKKGEWKALKNWECLSGMTEFYSEEIQEVKDAVKDSQHDVGVTWLDMAVVEAVVPAMKTVIEYFLRTLTDHVIHMCGQRRKSNGSRISSKRR